MSVDWGDLVNSWYAIRDLPNFFLTRTTERGSSYHSREQRFRNKIRSLVIVSRCDSRLCILLPHYNSLTLSALAHAGNSASIQQLAKILAFSYLGGSGPQVQHIDAVMYGLIKESDDSALAQ